MSEAIKETEEKIETQPEITEVKEPGEIIEKDGKLFIVEEAEEDSDKSKDEPSDKDEEVVEEAAKSKPADEGVGKPSELDRTDVSIKILTKKIEEQEKLLADVNLTPEQLLKRTPIKDLENDLPNQRAILGQIDEDLNPEEWARQNKIVSTIEANINLKREEAKLNERFNSKDNKEFLAKEREELKSNGFEFSEIEWETIAKSAESYLDEGKYSADAIHKGLTDILGADAVTKMYKISGEQKARKDVKIAAGKETKSVKITSTGKSGNVVSFVERIANMEPDEMERTLDRLTPQQYAIYKQELEKLKK